MRVKMFHIKIVGRKVLKINELHSLILNKYNKSTLNRVQHFIGTERNLWI